MSKAKKSEGWVKAIRPGTTPAGKFIKAGEKFQLEPTHEFSDTWMEHTDAPEPASADPKYVEEQDRRDLAVFEEQERVRNGKFTVASVPRKEDVNEADKPVKAKSK